MITMDLIVNSSISSDSLTLSDSASKERQTERKNRFKISEDQSYTIYIQTDQCKGQGSCPHHAATCTNDRLFLTCE